MLARAETSIPLEFEKGGEGADVPPSPKGCPMPRRLLDRFRDRLFEWIMTAAMLGLAIQIAAWPSTIGSSSLRFILHFISAENIAIFFLAFGLMRIAALIANGSWPEHGPRLRAMGAGASALMWGQMCAAPITLAAAADSVPSPDIPIFLMLTVGELISAYRATADARTPHR
jgi:hypothetical protein